MVDLNEYFDPVSIEKPGFDFLSGPASFSHNITIHTENNPIKDIRKFSIAIIGVPDGRNSPNAGSAKGPEKIREALYRLSRIQGKSRIIDLGNMKNGVTFPDTLAGLSDILTMLVQNDIFPLIIGGSSALITSVDTCFTRLNLQYTLTSIDSRIDFQPEKRDIDSSSFLNQIIYSQKNPVSQFINIGYQTYLNDQQTINRLLKRKSELMRIGDVRQALHLTEPLLRDSDAAVIDIGVVRQSDAPGTMSPSPNGFYGEEICLISRYAGISDRLKVFGLFEVNPDFDSRDQTTSLAAQIIWFFLDGFAQKQFETPVIKDLNSGRFIRYHVRVTDLDEELVFIKSSLTERWWIEIMTENNSSHCIACSYEDYLQANRNEVPDRWVKAVARLKS